MYLRLLILRYRELSWTTNVPRVHIVTGHIVTAVLKTESHCLPPDWTLRWVPSTLNSADFTGLDREIILSHCFCPWSELRTSTVWNFDFCLNWYLSFGQLDCTSNCLDEYFGLGRLDCTSTVWTNTVETKLNVTVSHCLRTEQTAAGLRLLSSNSDD